MSQIYLKEKLSQLEEMKLVAAENDEAKSKIIAQQAKELAEKDQALESQAKEIERTKRASIIALLQSGQLPKFIMSTLNVTIDYIRNIINENSITLTEQQNLDMN